MALETLEDIAVMRFFQSRLLSTVVNFHQRSGGSCTVTVYSSLREVPHRQVNASSSHAAKPGLEKSILASQACFFIYI